MRTLFIGCSHTMGYCASNLNQPVSTWQENNYAEIYSKIHNKKCVIMASAGTGNRVYPRFLAHAFKKYNDIDEVFIQSTYWGRFPVVINPELSYKKIFPIDFFLNKDSSDDLMDRWSISLSVDNKYQECFHRALPDDWIEFPYIRDTAPWISEPDVRRSSYLYFQMWHYQNTHLEQEDYMKDIAVCDMICANNNVPMYVWNINNRVYIPEHKNFYGEFTNTKFADISAEGFIKDKHSIDIETDKYRFDGEHYTYEIHEIIAKNYIDFIKNA